MDFNSFLTSLATSFVIFLVLMVVFAWLSAKPANHVVYYPNRILKGLDPTGGSTTRSPFAWIQEALSTSEQDVISMSGVDTAVYFVFMATGLFFSFFLECFSFNFNHAFLGVFFFSFSIAALFLIPFSNLKCFSAGDFCVICRYSAASSYSSCCY